MIVDHRSTEAFAELGEIATQFDIAEPRCGELLLKGRDRHYAVVGVVEMASCLLGLHPPRALHEHAGDDLEAVGNAMLEFLEQDRLLAQQVILEFFADARFGHVGDGQRSEEHTSELQSLMRISYAVFCLKKKNKHSDT